MSQRHTNSSALSLLAHPNLDRPLSLRPSPLQDKASVTKGKKKVGSAVYPTRGGKDVLSDTIVQKLVTPQVALQPTNVDRVRVLEAVQLRQLDVEPHFVALVLVRVAVHRGCQLARRDHTPPSSRKYGRAHHLGRGCFGLSRDLRRLAAHEQALEHPPRCTAERRL